MSDPNYDSLLVDSINNPQVTTNMSSNSFTSAYSGILYDNGGPAGNYAANSDDLYRVLVSGDDSSVFYKVVVEQMNLESPYDTLEIYNILYQGDRIVLSGTITGTWYFPAKGHLYFHFKSNTVNQLAGFKIRWSRVGVPASSVEQAPQYGWYFNPQKAAMRGGTQSGNNWATPNLGYSSFAYGVSNQATGEYSVSLGFKSKATGSNAIALGNNAAASAQYATAIGSLTEATAYASTAIGNSTNAWGMYSTALGNQTTAIGDNATAMGTSTIASGDYSTGMGKYAYAIGYAATAIGDSTEARGLVSFASGFRSAASGSYSTAMGYKDTAVGSGSIAIGLSNIASGYYSGSIAIGQGNTASSTYTSTAIGYNNIVSSNYGSAAIGGNNTSNANYSTAIGFVNTASGGASTAIGNYTTASGDYSTTLGYNTTASGINAMATGRFTKASGYTATAIGDSSEANGTLSFASGFRTIATGNSSVTMGRFTKAAGYAATAIGDSSEAGGVASFAAGYKAKANGDNSVALGTYSNATGPFSTAMGHNIIASGDYSTAMGENTTASGNFSVAMGHNTIASGSKSTVIGYQTSSLGFACTVVGMNNSPILLTPQTSVASTTPLFIVGNGDNISSLNNALVVRKDGNIGIGTDFPNANLHIKHAAGGGIILENSNDGNQWRIYSASGDNNLTFYNDAGTEVADIDDVTGTFNAISDGRLKKNIQTIPSVLPLVMKLDPSYYHFNWQKQDEQKQVGFIAQDAYKLFPELVSYNKEKDLYKMNYAGFSTVAIKAIQEQQAIIENQQRQIDELKALVNELIEIKKTSKNQ